MNDTEIEKELGELNETLRNELVYSKAFDINEWNTKFAPALSKIAQAIKGSTITARTYKLPSNFFEE